MIFTRQFSLIMMIFALFIFNSMLMAQSANGQFLPDIGKKQLVKPADPLETYLKEVHKGGLTIIVVKPGIAAEEINSSNNLFNTEELLSARALLLEIIYSAPSLLSNIDKTLSITSPNGNYLWLLRAIFTAAGGLFIGWLIIKPIQKGGVEYFRYMYDPDPVTTADKAQYLIFRLLLASVYAVIFFVAAMGISILFDSGGAASRQVIFEVIFIYAAFRILQRGIGWNFFAYDAPSHRLVNLNDEEAVALDRGVPRQHS